MIKIKNNKAGSLDAGVDAQNNYKLIVWTLDTSVM